jgi:hypothetical protein
VEETVDAELERIDKFCEDLIYQPVSVCWWRPRFSF